MPPPHRLERVDEMRVDRDELGLRMLFAHQIADRRAVLLPRVDQDQEFSRFDVAVEFLEVVVFAGDAGQLAAAARPLPS